MRHVRLVHVTKSDGELSIKTDPFIVLMTEVDVGLDSNRGMRTSCWITVFGYFSVAFFAAVSKVNAIIPTHFQ